MDNPWLHNSWSYHRDCHGLLYRRPTLLMDCEDEDEAKDKTQFNNHQQSLNHLSNRIRNLLDDVRFRLECLHYITRQLSGHGPCVGQYESSTISRADAPDELQVLSYKEAITETHLKIFTASLQDLVKLLLSGAPLHYSDATSHPPPQDIRTGEEQPKLSDPLQDDAILLRVHTRNSNSPYDDQVGFRCSKWKAVCFGDEHVLDDFVKHMENTVHPSPYISVFESAAGLLEHINAKAGSKSASRIMAISTKRLLLLGISTTKRTELQSRFAVPDPDGSAGPRNTDWLVKYWIPKEAIVDEMSVERFAALAKNYQILDDNLNIVDKNHKVRIPPDAFPVIDIFNGVWHD